MILISGANGLLGSYLSNLLLSKGKKVIGLVRDTGDLSLLPTDHPNLTLHNGDVLDILSLEAVFQENEIEKVIHAAAVVSYRGIDRELMEKVNVEGTTNLLNMSLKHKVKRFLHVSSVAALGQKTSGVVNEETPWVNGTANSNYSITKHAAEAEVWRAQVEGLNTVIVNPSIILSAADGYRSSSRFFNYLMKNPLFYPTGILNYVDVRDVAEISLSLLENEVTNERFILNGGSISYKEFFEMAAISAGLRPPSMPIKKITGNVALIGEIFRSKLLNTKPLLTTESLRTSRRKVIFDSKKISDFLNYQFLPLTETIDWVWEQYNSFRRIEK